MKLVDLEKNKLNKGLLKRYEKFDFSCHHGVSCFNKCCKNQNIFLYPYDIILIKKKLGISSGEFIDKYTDVILRKGNYFPDVLLKMEENEEKSCPFLSGRDGCAIYEDRPATCRLFPLEHGVLFDDKEKPKSIFFLKPPGFCKGIFEEKTQNYDDWFADQGVAKHINMNVLWSGVNGLFAVDPWGNEGAEGSRAKIAFMAAYNPDDFKKFLFESSFFKKYKVKSDIKKKIDKIDTELMKFGFAFIKYTVFGIKTKLLKAR